MEDAEAEEPEGPSKKAFRKEVNNLLAGVDFNTMSVRTLVSQVAEKFGLTELTQKQKDRVLKLLQKAIEQRSAANSAANSDAEPGEAEATKAAAMDVDPAGEAEATKPAAMDVDELGPER